MTRALVELQLRCPPITESNVVNLYPVCPQCQKRLPFTQPHISRLRCHVCRHMWTRADDAPVVPPPVDEVNDTTCEGCGKAIRDVQHPDGSWHAHVVRPDGQTGKAHLCSGYDTDRNKPGTLHGGRPESNRRKF